MEETPQEQDEPMETTYGVATFALDSQPLTEAIGADIPIVQSIDSPPIESTAGKRRRTTKKLADV